MSRCHMQVQISFANHVICHGHLVDLSHHLGAMTLWNNKSASHQINDCEPCAEIQEGSRTG
eukprot:34190-Hanusia_phi.AAC.4